MSGCYRFKEHRISECKYRGVWKQSRHYYLAPHHPLSCDGPLPTPVLAAGNRLADIRQMRCNVHLLMQHAHDVDRSGILTKEYQMRASAMPPVSGSDFVNGRAEQWILSDGFDGGLDHSQIGFCLVFIPAFGGEVPDLV